MKEIKFRAWDKEYGRMEEIYCFFPETETVWTKRYWEWRIANDKKSKGKKESEPETHHFELMQFTGLIDKRSKEIYEGDIVKDFAGTVGTIVWLKNRYTLKCSSGYLYLNEYFLLPKDFEILGNIFENPELIK